MRGRKKINDCVSAQKKSYPQVRLFFQDEAGFGRINELKGCWCPEKTRPVVHKQMAREHLTIFGAVEPKTGDFFHMIEPRAAYVKGTPGRKKKGVRVKRKARKRTKGWKSRQMNEFMKRLVNVYRGCRIVLVCDNAWWHKSQYIKIPKRITLLNIPPYTPEMNPIEQLWRELRTRDFYNKYFETIDDVETTLRSTIAELPKETIRSITQRDWIMKCA